MSDQTIGQGPGNLVPDSEKKSFLANGAIVKGDVVGLSGVTGYTVDQANATTILPIGVAAESGTDVWIEVVIGGFCDYVTNNGTDVVAGDYLACVAGEAVPLTMAEADPADGTDGYELNIFGQSLGAETGTTCTEVIIYKRF